MPSVGASNITKSNEVSMHWDPVDGSDFPITVPLEPTSERQAKETPTWDISSLLEYEAKKC
jgi:hypothetical protein